MASLKLVEAGGAALTGVDLTRRDSAREVRLGKLAVQRAVAIRVT